MEDDELDECALGTKEFWDNRYEEDIKHYHGNGDVGEIWFGDDIVDRIVRWLNKYNGDNKSRSIVDVGCGNGMLLVELFREGYTNLKGVDYSAHAVTLAKEIAMRENYNISYESLDLLQENDSINAIDIILDKGTYDAISLSANAKTNRNTYISNIHKFLSNDGVLVITSCNWTQDELIEQFQSKFQYFETIPTPQFKFAGKVGSVVSSVILKKK